MTSTVPSADLAGLDLPGLRAYREALSAEEDKVSYWRRLTQARVDVLEAQAGSEVTLGFEDLVRVLGDTGTGRARRALIRIPAAEPLPDLPELSEMWTTELDGHDHDRVLTAVTRLRRVEAQLSGYRQALHGRIDEATRELILRYREDPRAALEVLPRR